MQNVKNILISDSLREILSHFKNESIVADLLLSEYIREDFLVGEPVSFLSISDSDLSKISYLTRDRATKIPSEEFWVSSKRFHGKPGTVINKIFRDISEKEIEKFSTLFRSFSCMKEFNFEVVRGRDIVKYYGQNTYSSGGGSLGNSCMKYDRCQRFLDFYKDNDAISMLIMKNNENYLIGRALLWDFNDNKIMDRIYTTNDEDYQFYFKKWAKNNGYSYKMKQNWANTIQLVNNSENFDGNFEIQLNSWNYEYYPYLDTFKWLDTKIGKLYNYKPSHFENHQNDYKVLMSPDGRYATAECLEFDSISKDWHHQGSLQFIPEHNLYTNRDNLNYSETLDKWLLKTESKYDEDLRDYIYNDIEKVDIKLLNDRKDFINRLLENEKRQEEIRLKNMIGRSGGRSLRNPYYDIYSTLENVITRYNNEDGVSEHPMVDSETF